MAPLPGDASVRARRAETRARPWGGVLGRAALTVASLLIGALATETATWALFRWPGLWLDRVPEPVEALLRFYHANFLGGGPIQVRPECMEPDPDLVYRLKTGECRYDTDEFDTRVRVSTRHLREDHVVTKPSLVFLGDSFTLGWGVEREEAYPAMVARKLARPAVVVANSSYGTVRELLLLRRLALADFEAVVWQYYANDAPENEAFLKTLRPEPTPSSAAAYGEAVRVWSRVNAKRFFRYTHHWLSMAFWSVTRPEPPVGHPVAVDEQARMALRVLGAFAAELRGRPILVFSADRGPDSAAFARALNAAPKPVGLGPVRAIDVTPELTAADYFRLDIHWRPSGHRTIANAIAANLASLSSAEPARP